MFLFISLSTKQGLTFRAIQSRNVSPRWVSSAGGITLPCNDRSELKSVEVDSRVNSEAGVTQDLMPLAESNAGDS